MQSTQMGAYPDSNIGRHIDVSRIRIWLVLIDRRGPVNGDATQNEAKKDWQTQPVTPAHQELCFLTTSTPGCSGNVLAEFGSQSGSVEWVIAQNPCYLVSGDVAAAIRRILFVISVPFGSFSVAA